MAKMVAVCQQGLKPPILRVQATTLHHHLLCSSITLHKHKNLLLLDILFQAVFQNHKGTPTQLQTCTKTQTHSLTDYFRKQATAIQNGRTRTNQKARGGAYHLHN